MVEALKAEGETIDHCLVGEPTSVERLGDVIKIGRRGSVNAWITVEGGQGHVAYPHRAANPIPVLVACSTGCRRGVSTRAIRRFRPRTSRSPPSTSAIGATNVIPAKAQARLNIRFNPTHTGAELVAWLEPKRGQGGRERLPAWS